MMYNNMNNDMNSNMNYQNPPEQKNGMATASLVLGILGLILSCVCIGGVLSIIGLVLGIASKKNGPNSKATAGIVLSSIGLAFTALILIWSMVSPSTNTTTTTLNTNKTVVDSVNTSSSDNNETITTSPVKNAETKYYVGDTVTTGLYDFTITKVTTKNKVGSTYLNKTPSEGGIYVCIEFEYKNISDAPISMWKEPRINLIDKNNNKYSQDISASSYYATEYDIDSKILSDLNPGIKVKDADVYEISEESWNKGGWTIKVDADKDFVVNIDKP